MASTIQIRVDDDLKNKSDQLFKDLGTDTTSAIRMFLTQCCYYTEQQLSKSLKYVHCMFYSSVLLTLPFSLD